MIFINYLKNDEFVKNTEIAVEMTKILKKYILNFDYNDSAYK